MDDTERRVAMEIGAQAQDAPRGQRHHLREKQQQLVQEGEREKEFVRSQLSSEFHQQRP